MLHSSGLTSKYVLFPISFNVGKIITLVTNIIDAGLSLRLLVKYNYIVSIGTYS